MTASVAVKSRIRKNSIVSTVAIYLILGIIGVVIALIVLIVLAANPDLQERIIQTIMGQTPDVSLPDIKVPESIG